MTKSYAIADKLHILSHVCFYLSNDCMFYSDLSTFFTIGFAGFSKHFAQEVHRERHIDSALTLQYMQLSCFYTKNIVDITKKHGTNQKAWPTNLHFVLCEFYFGFNSSLVYFTP